MLNIVIILSTTTSCQYYQAWFRVHRREGPLVIDACTKDRTGVPEIIQILTGVLAYVDGLLRNLYNFPTYFFSC